MEKACCILCRASASHITLVHNPCSNELRKWFFVNSNCTMVCARTSAEALMPQAPSFESHPTFTTSTQTI